MTEKKKCKTCSKRLNISSFPCKCQDFYCATHRSHLSHDCNHDYRKSYTDLLTLNNPKVVADKVQRI